ncbi:hypothetical protein [Raineya orbicola]|uniref:Uncharacterized protein n=1 Tax=Raineya orbicola TaxID=2016530 RepID=A0A2N3IBG4_9BACT|nr:hypothetical protein [Raineya orbicola]PKQ67682.1 hypothetical protein Rain11_1957 [Raineya orbicola]
MVRFSVKYLPTALFSLKDSNATNSGAKSLFLPSPYSVKMALLNQIITIEGVEIFNPKEEETTKGKKKKLQESEIFEAIRDAKISFYLPQGSKFCVNNAFVKILKIKEDKSSKKDKEAGKIFEPGFQETISFREYIQITHPLEIIFEVSDTSQEVFLKNYLHKINYFGKRGCFFQFLEYNDNPPEANVVPFDVKKGLSGILQKYDDFDELVTFEMVNNFSGKSTKRKEEIWVLPLRSRTSSKSYTSYVSI